MKKLILLGIFNAILVLGSLHSDHRSSPPEKRIRTSIRANAENLLISTLKQPPTSLGNVVHINQVLDYFNALQADFLTTQYHEHLRTITQKALIDQNRYNYMEILSPRGFELIMKQRVKKGMELYIEQTVVALEDIRERGKTKPRELKLAPTQLTLEEQIMKLRDETKIRHIIEKKAEEIMINALRQPPTSLGNVLSIKNIIDHFNALQAPHLTNEYIGIVEKISKKAIADYLEHDFLRVISDDTFEGMMEKRISYGLKGFVPKAIEALEEVRETGRDEPIPANS